MNHLTFLSNSMLMPGAMADGHGYSSLGRS